MATSDLEVVRWYTSARRFPKLIGRFQDGRAIPGGPYTQTQFIAGASTVVIAAKTPGLWAHFGLVTNTALLVGFTWAVVWGLGRLPTGGRNPLLIGKGLVAAASAPPMGKIAGRKITLRRPHAVNTRVAISPRTYDSCPAPDAELVSAPAPAPEQVVSLAAAPAAVRPPMPMTGVQALLASAGRNGS